MIKTFKQFNEAFNADDMRNSLDYGIEKNQNKLAQNPDQKNSELNLKNDAKLKITDIENRMRIIDQQKKLITDEIIKLQNAQRDLMPNNPDDPNNAKTQQEFVADQTEKINIQQAKVQALDDEIANLQKEVERNKQKYF
jgi:uncharacterized small protein (DUF1192 family)